MRPILVLFGAWAAWCARAGDAGAVHNGSRYGFYRDMGDTGCSSGTRRLFGGSAAPLDTWGAVCVLLDRYWVPRCSGAVVASRWVLTAGHCVTPHLAYVKYNSRRAAVTEGDVSAVQYLYRHPQYRVVQQDQGRGMDVTLLHHDVGLVRTRTDMSLTVPPPTPPLRSLETYDPMDLTAQEVEVLGFGRTESASSEELFAVRLRLSACERDAWLHCVCGTASAAGRPAGVCYGDSGGPVVFRGAQVGVTSMGPLECTGDARIPLGSTATSVFTALHRYASLFNATIFDADESLRMARVARSGAAPYRPSCALCACLLYLVRLVVRTTSYMTDTH